MCDNNNLKDWLMISVFLVGFESVTASGDIKAINPYPSDGFVIRNTWTRLSFTPGDTALSHDVYFGENYSDVDTGIGDTFRGSQTETSLIVGLPGYSTIYPNGLVLGTTYYWRIDEFDGLDTHKGDTWSFKVGSRFFVDVHANGANNGNSWVDAFNHLQDALIAAQWGDTIWVAEGTYRPDRGGGQTPGDRNATFQLRDYVAIYGGFTGDEVELMERNWLAHETILSGDLKGDDVTGASKDNAYHVVTGSGTPISALLDGFIITGGNATWPVTFTAHAWDGGGMLNEGGSPTVRNCRFINNSAGNGGGMFNVNQSSPNVVSCMFISNNADVGGGMYNSDSSNPWILYCMFIGNSADLAVSYGGGGVYNSHSSPPVDSCTFLENHARRGGGMTNISSSSPNIRNCSFIRNRADDSGGGMFNTNASGPKVSNCAFSQNSADHSGGGIFNWDDSRLEITNCIFVGNSASEPTPVSGSGGAIDMTNSNVKIVNSAFVQNSAKYYGGAVESYDNDSEFINCTFIGNSGGTGGAARNCASGYFGTKRHMRMTNCVLWDNTATLGSQIAVQLSAILSISFCDLQGGQPAMYLDSNPTIVWGDGMIEADPLFRDTDGRLSDHSPCIDAGNNMFVPAGINTDLDGKSRLEDDPSTIDIGPGTPPIVDMGAYEFDPSSDYDAYCLKRGFQTVFEANFESDQIGSTPASTSPGRYGPLGASLETFGTAETYEIVNSAELGSKALKITRSSGALTRVKAVVGDIFSAAYTKDVYYIDFEACAREIPEESYGTMSIRVQSADDKVALSLRLYDSAYYLAEGDSYIRLTGSYNINMAHHVHIELDLVAYRYSICIDGELLVSSNPLLTSNFKNMHSLEFFVPQMILEGFMSVYVVDDILITKQPLAKASPEGIITKQPSAVISTDSRQSNGDRCTEAILVNK